MQERALSGTRSGHCYRSVRCTIAVLIVASLAVPANADWQCTPGANGERIYSPEYVPGVVSYKGHDKSFYRKTMTGLMKRLRIRRQLAKCDERNNCSFSRDFYSSLGVNDKNTPTNTTAMTVCTSIPSPCIAGFCSKNELYHRLIFDWNGGFVDFTLITSKPHQSRIKEDLIPEVNITLTERIIDIWPRHIGISRTDSVNFSYTALRKE